MKVRFSNMARKSKALLSKTFEKSREDGGNLEPKLRRFDENL